MQLSPGSTELLAGLPAVLQGLGLQLLDPAGEPAWQCGSVATQDGVERRLALPNGTLVAQVPAAAPAVLEWIDALLASIGAREQLESDMESMSSSALRLLQTVTELTETLPRLSIGNDDLDIATQGARACMLAAGVQQVFYLSLQSNRAAAEVLVHCSQDAAGNRQSAAVELIQATDEGLLAEILLLTEGVVLRSVPGSGRLGAEGSPEALARHQVLGVPVTYGAGDKRVVLGALLLLDKQANAYSATQLIGSEECHLAESFAAMLGAVLGARKTAAFGKELSLAQAIQRQILPDRTAAVPGFDVAGHYEACGAVGGDYFDYVPLADGRTLVVIADVSGHNLASGMMMVSARATLRTLASVRHEPARVFEDLAASMHADLTRTERFLTAAGLALRAHDRSVEYVSAGHNDLLVYRAAADRVEAIASDSTILGFLPSPEYGARTLVLAPGDCLLLFTDGITEATNAEGEMFGDDRLATLLAQLAPGRHARAILQALVHELYAFRGGQVGSDDVTAVVIRCVEEVGRT